MAQRLAVMHQCSIAPKQASSAAAASAKHPLSDGLFPYGLLSTALQEGKSHKKGHYQEQVQY